MQYKNTVEAINIYLDEIQKIVSQIGANEQIYTIDIDLAAEKMRHVYDLLFQLKNESVPEDRDFVDRALLDEKGPKKPEPKVSVEEKETIEFDLDIDPEPEQESLEKEIYNEPVKEDVPQKTQAEIDSRVKPMKEKKFLSDSFEGKTKSLNDELSNKSGAGKITDKLSSKPISSVSSAIGINEKFEIIKNLFGGSGDSYENTMHVLNTAANFNDAYEYMSKKLAWDMDDPQVQRILELIRRKLIVKKNDA